MEEKTILLLLSPIVCVIISSLFLWNIKKSVANLDHSHSNALTFLRSTLDRDLKEFEARLNRQSSVLAMIFDKEYTTYQDLWKKLLIFQQTTSLTFSIMLLHSMKWDEHKSEIDKFKKAHASLGEVTENNSPFVDKIILKAIYDLMNGDQIKELCLYSIRPDSFVQKHINRDSALKIIDEMNKHLTSSVQDIADMIRSRIALMLK